MIKEYENELNELKESKLISKEDLHEGDEIIYNGEHYFVTRTDTGTDFVWITDDESERYNRNAQGWTLKADWIDKVIGQPEEDELEESLKESYKKRYKKSPVMEDLDFTNATDVRYRLDKYSGQYLTVTFRGPYAWKHISDLLEEYADGDEEDADLALDKLESIYGSEYKLLKALEVDEISEIAAYISDVLVTIKVDKDDLYHNYADLINNPSIKKDTVKILELELNESLKKRYKKFLLKESTSKEKETKEKTIKEDLDFTDEAEIRKQLAKYSGQYLTITFKGSEDWKHISDLLDESINSDEEEEEELALDKLEASYGREYDLLKSLEVEEISEITDYTSYVIITIKVEKDNLLHNFSDNYLDFIHMPSIDTDTIKILELDKPTIQDTNTSSMTRDEMVDFIADYVGDLSDTEYRKFKDKIALNFGIIWDNLKEDPEEEVYPSFTDNGLRIIIDKIIKAAKLKDESLKEDYQNIDSMSRRNLMDEIDDIYRWARQSHRTGITSIIEDPEVFNSNDSDSEEGYFKGVPTDKLRGVLKILRKMKDDGSKTEKDQEFLLSKEVDLHESVESKEIIKEDVNMSRKEMIDWIEDHWNDTVEHGEWLYNYLTELGFNVEDDSDEEEGFYANLTTSDLRKVINELNPNTEVSVKERIMGIRKALETLGKVSDVSLDYAGAEEATFDVDFKDGNTFRIQIYRA